MPAKREERRLKGRPFTYVLLVALVGALVVAIIAATPSFRDAIQDRVNALLDRQDDGEAQQLDGQVTSRPAHGATVTSSTSAVRSLTMTGDTAAVHLRWTSNDPSVRAFDLQLRARGVPTWRSHRVPATARTHTFKGLDTGRWFEARVVPRTAHREEASAIATARTAGFVRRFPTAVSKDGRFFLDDQGAPWFGHGDTAWSLFVELSERDAMAYLDDRARRGFNLVLVNVIEHHFTSNPPKNADGDPPFDGTAFSSPPNDAYFDHVERLVEYAAQRGVTLLLCPSYHGSGWVDGWWNELAAASDADLAHYGRYLAKRFADDPNVIWLIGHDQAPDDVIRSRQEALAGALPTRHLVGLGGLQSIGPLATPQWKPTTIVPDFETVYTYTNLPDDTTRAHESVPRRPVVFLEGLYEQESDTPLGAAILRQQTYGPFLSGASAVIFGNNPIWHFQGRAIYPYVGTWEENLSSPGSIDAAFFGQVVRGGRWWLQAPDQGPGSLLVAGRGHGFERASVRTGDGGSVLYFPTSRSVDLDLSRVSSERAIVFRLDPTTGSFVRLGVFETDAILSVELPRRNDFGDEDWVLLVRAR